MKTKNISTIVAILAIAFIGAGCNGIFGGNKASTATPPQFTAVPPVKAPAPVVPTATLGGLATATVATPASPAPKSVAVDPSSGVSNGVPCLFVNKAASALTVTVVMEGGVSFTFDLPANGRTSLKVPPGTYSYTWTVEDNPTVYNGDSTFPVTKTPTKHFLNAGKWESYNGGVLFGGK